MYQVSKVKCERNENKRRKKFTIYIFYFFLTFIIIIITFISLLFFFLTQFMETTNDCYCGIHPDAVSHLKNNAFSALCAYHCTQFF